MNDFLVETDQTRVNRTRPGQRKDHLTRSERRIADRLAEAVSINADSDRRIISDHLAAITGLSPDRVIVVLTAAGMSFRQARRVARLRFLLEQKLYLAGRPRSLIPPIGYMITVEALPPRKLFRIPPDSPLPPDDAHLAAHLHACLYADEYSHAHTNQLDDLLAMPWARRRAVMGAAVDDSNKFKKISRLVRYHRRCQEFSSRSKLGIKKRSLSLLFPSRFR